jgi:hypothetical protein
VPTLNSPAATALTIQSAGTTAMTVDTSQNVGIGTSSPSSFGKFVVTGSAGTTYVGGGGDQLAFSKGGTNYITTTTAGGQIQFQTGAGSNAMLLDSSGSLLVGATSAPATFKVYAERSGAQYGLRHSSSTAGQYFFMQTDTSNTFYIQSQSLNGVYLTNTGTSWNAVSDERAKDIIEAITDAATKVSTLRAVIGSYKNDDTKKRRSFLIAQDVQAVLPESVDDTNPDNLGLAYTDVIPLLVAAIQELSAKNDGLEARIATIEANATKVA